MTTAFVEVVEAGQCSSYPHLMDALHRSLRRNHFDQRPLLSASQVSGEDPPYCVNAPSSYMPPMW